MIGRYGVTLKRLIVPAVAGGMLLLAPVASTGQEGGAEAVQPSHAIAMHGEPALPPIFQHFPYADPRAPKGGQIVYGVQGTFDSLNPFVIQGLPALGVSGNVVESLMARSYDEPFTLYGLIAESIRVPKDRSWVEFRIDDRAQFSDGRSITAEDVVFSWQLLKNKGRPNHRLYYSKVAKAEALDQKTVRFDLAGAEDRELPLILGMMPILAKHVTDPETFEAGGWEPLLGSGPYVIDEVRRGESLTLTRNPRYWAADHAATRGHNNFDKIRYDYYRDANTLFEAFKRGLVDLRIETEPGRWMSGYDFPGVRDGKVVMEELETGTPKGMNGFVFNTRRPLFSDVRVREALGLLFDFEWMNANLFGGAYSRTSSYFEGSELTASGRPASPAENALLTPFEGVVRDDILAGTWRPSVSDGSGRDRRALARALNLFAEAGWAPSNGALRRDGKRFAFEIMVRTKDQERVALAYAKSLERAGIMASVRLIDALQFERRLAEREFDMTVYFWLSSLSPGNEQSLYWSSAAADQPGSRNYAGVDEPAADAMIAAILGAETRENLVTATRALDRVLLSGFYTVPLYHAPKQWLARWSRIDHPIRNSLFGPIFETWWHKEPAP
ncbi:ABC transporter substrate-binding protein [Agaricicola taiwanensis]|uniref:ABC transporter substrate-binding protein n=1 Tax=Agaricicola taiwanensis TaxID=591372 RepID=A0A8J2YJ15_9RHOB|nr:extracellular solute-binding protein [Agaricicola taiwanensis]GGE45844.1 ABC transporter substrate-binding protein [Agaricicola taiwanensis]